MVINVLELVPHCYSWQNGQVIAAAIRQVLDANEKVTVSFAGVDDVPSTFVNGAFVALLDFYSFDRLREDVLVINSTRQINDMIKRRLMFESQRGPQAA
jgi:hypothetical protein